MPQDQISDTPSQRKQNQHGQQLVRDRYLATQPEPDFEDTFRTDPLVQVHLSHKHISQYHENGTPGWQYNPSAETHHNDNGDDIRNQRQRFNRPVLLNK